MSKIVQAVNTMIANPNLITKVIKGGNENESEFFFLYKNKYKWSMVKREEGHRLWFYPGANTLEQLARYDGPEWEQVPMIAYVDTAIGTKEAKASFSELYTLLEERVYGLNEVLDDIINTGTLR